MMPSHRVNQRWVVYTEFLCNREMDAMIKSGDKTTAGELRTGRYQTVLSGGQDATMVRGHFTFAPIVMDAEVLGRDARTITRGGWRFFIDR